MLDRYRALRVAYLKDSVQIRKCQTQPGDRMNALVSPGPSSDGGRGHDARSGGTIRHDSMKSEIQQLQSTLEPLDLFCASTHAFSHGLPSVV